MTIMTKDSKKSKNALGPYMQQLQLHEHTHTDTQTLTLAISHIWVI